VLTYCNKDNFKLEPDCHRTGGSMNKELIDLYTDYLISSFDQTTATGLSRLLDGALTHDSITNFLAESHFTAKDLWKLVKRDIRKHESTDGVLIIDDTIIEKPHTDENSIVSWHHDHTSGRSIKGVNVLSCLYHNDKLDMPLSYEIIHKEEVYVDPKDGKTKRRSNITKNDLMHSMLQTIHQYNIKYSYVLADSWFSSADNMVFIKTRLKKNFVMALRSNRLVATSMSEKLQGRYMSMDSLNLKVNEVRAVFLRGLSFEVALVKQIFKNKDGSEGFIYLASSDTSLDFNQLTTIYQKRWKVEEYHKSIKSNTGLAKSPTRVVKTQSNHFFLSIYAFVKLERLKICHLLSHFSLKSKIYIKAIKASFTELNRLQNLVLTG
jgi:DDE superfamily endonuclease